MLRFQPPTVSTAWLGGPDSCQVHRLAQRGDWTVPLYLCPLMPKGLNTELGGKRAGAGERLDQLPVWSLGQVPPSPWASASSRPHSERGVIAWKGCDG